VLTVVFPSIAGFELRIRLVHSYAVWVGLLSYSMETATKPLVSKYLHL